MAHSTPRIVKYNAGTPGSRNATPSRESAVSATSAAASESDNQNSPALRASRMQREAPASVARQDTSGRRPRLTPPINA